MPRLVSVVEIIKREYIKTLELAHSPRLTGLHQYNEVGSLEALGLAPSPQDTAEDRAEELIRKLEGKKCVCPSIARDFCLNLVSIKLVQTPYMKITLSLSELPELKAQGATCVLLSLFAFHPSIMIIQISTPLEAQAIEVCESAREEEREDCD